VHPELSGWQFANPIGDFVHRYVQRSADVAGLVLVWLADIEHDGPVLTGDVGQRGEVGHSVGAQLTSSGEFLDRFGGGTGDVVDTDPDEFPPAFPDLGVAVADEGQRRTPGVKPTDVGDERVRQFESPATR
jgi:hypothetical protein